MIRKNIKVSKRANVTFRHLNVEHLAYKRILGLQQGYCGCSGEDPPTPASRCLEEHCPLKKDCWVGLPRDSPDVIFFVEHDGLEDSILIDRVKRRRRH